MNNNAVDSNTIIEKQLDEGIRNLQEIFDADLLTFIGFLIYGADDQVRYGLKTTVVESFRMVV